MGGLEARLPVLMLIVTEGRLLCFHLLEETLQARQGLHRSEYTREQASEQRKQP